MQAPTHPVCLHQATADIQLRKSPGPATPLQTRMLTNLHMFCSRRAGKPSGDQHKPKQQPSKNSSSSSTPAAPLVPAPPPSKPAWGGAGVTAAAARPPQQQQPSDQGATTNNKSSSNGTIQNTSGSSSQVDAAVPPSGAAHDQSAQQQPQQQVAALSKLPPGFATVHYKGRPCQLMMLRGCCPMGDKCPYDHPPRAGESARLIQLHVSDACQRVSAGLRAAEDQVSQGHQQILLS